MAKYNSVTPVKNLPDAFLKTPDSNNNKLLSIDRGIINTISNNLQTIFEISDIDSATGKSLDMIGEELRVKRGKSSDEQYRLRIKGKIAQNLSDGTREKIAEVLSFVLQCKTSDIQIVSGETTGGAILKGISLEKVISANFTTEQVNSLINALLPAGVELQSFLYTGTFEFSVSENEYAENAGFSDIEGGTIGGYFGLLSE